MVIDNKNNRNMVNIKLYEEFINENYGIISKGDYPSFYITFNNKCIFMFYKKQQ